MGFLGGAFMGGGREDLNTRMRVQCDFEFLTYFFPHGTSFDSTKSFFLALALRGLTINVVDVYFFLAAQARV